MKTAGIVLCGGHSSRMGRAKALLPWRGRPVIAHVVDLLREATDEVVVVSSETLELPPLPAPVVVDREPDLGPLAGIREGLAAVTAELAFVTATDAPFLTPQTVRALFSHGCAAAPELDGRVQPLCAVYPRSCLPDAEALITAGRLRPFFLLQAAGFRRLRGDELPDPNALRSFNTPAEYLDAVREIEPDARARLRLVGRARDLAGRAVFDVPPATLGEVFSHAGPGPGLCANDELAAPYLASLNGQAVVRDLSVPIGPGEEVVVMDRTAPDVRPGGITA